MLILSESVEIIPIVYTLCNLCQGGPGTPRHQPAGGGPPETDPGLAVEEGSKRSKARCSFQGKEGVGSWAARRALCRHLEAWAETRRGRRQEKLEEKCFLIHGSAQGHHVALLQPETYHLFACQFIHSFTGAGDLYCVLCTEHKPSAMGSNAQTLPPGLTHQCEQDSTLINHEHSHVPVPTGGLVRGPADTKLWVAEDPYIKRRSVCL